GFSFKGLSGLFVPASNFWKKTTAQFERYNPQIKVDAKHLSELVWVESQFHFSNGYAEDFPFATCAEKNGSSLPEKFLFYDSGLLLDLSISSYSEYLVAMVQSAAVTCWQYFYTTPKNLIDKNNGISYFPWHLAASDLADGINDMGYRDEINVDRLDLIAEY